MLVYYLLALSYLAEIHKAKRQSKQQHCHKEKKHEPSNTFKRSIQKLHVESRSFKEAHPVVDLRDE